MWPNQDHTKATHVACVTASSTRVTSPGGIPHLDPTPDNQDTAREKEKKKKDEEEEKETKEAGGRRGKKIESSKKSQDSKTHLLPRTNKGR